MDENIVQDIVLARQAAENDFIAAIKAKQPDLLPTYEKLLRDGFLAGFYDAYRNLRELNKLQRRIISRQRKEKSEKPVDKPATT